MKDKTIRDILIVIFVVGLLMSIISSFHSDENNVYEDDAAVFY
jgi:hypothetical protein